MLTTIQTKTRNWLNVRSTVIDDMITLDGPGNKQLNSCKSCANNQAQPLYRCRECAYSLLYCGECILKAHAALPLHRLEVPSYSSIHAIFVLNASSAGRKDFSIRPLSIPLDTSVISGMMAMHVPRTRLTNNSPLSTSTVGTNYKLHFANVVRVMFHMRTTANSSTCTGTPRPIIARKQLSPLTFSKHTTKSHYRENSTYTTSTIPSCRNLITKDGPNQW
jgi:hypothetical protein